MKQRATLFHRVFVPIYISSVVVLVLVLVVVVVVRVVVHRSFFS